MKNWQTSCKIHETGEKISPTRTVVDQFCHYAMDFWATLFLCTYFPITVVVSKVVKRERVVTE